jgi:hypothetical protein
MIDWKKGKGKMGVFRPFLDNNWVNRPEPEQPGDNPNDMRVTRTFQTILHGKYVEMNATWEMKDTTYEDRTLFGVDKDKQIHFWSFTSDGKNSNGILCDASDLHPEAIGFEAQMPSGTARQVFWPHNEGFKFVVESRTKKGWNRFVEHFYEPVK